MPAAINGMKECSKCHEVKAVGEFAKAKNRKDGLNYSCRECCKEEYEKNKKERSRYYKKRYTENKDQIKEARKKYYSENRDKIKERRKEYYTENKESVMKKNKLWRENNLERSRKIAKRSREKNKEKIAKRKKERRKKQFDNLEDVYIRQRLKDIGFIEINDDLIELKRINLKYKRAKRELE